MKCGIFKSGSVLDYSADWWVESDGKDIDFEKEITENGYLHAFAWGDGSGGESVEVRVYSAVPTMGPTGHPAYLLNIALCGNGEFVFAQTMFDALGFLRWIAPIFTANTLTGEAWDRHHHLIEHARKKRWDDYCFWCAHERRVSD